MSSLTNQHILLGITGGIAAYKSAELVRRLKEAGAQVRVVMTPAAEQFITPLTLQALSGQPVVTDAQATQSEFAMDHIALARWANVILIAPATADFMARLAHGMANDVLSTLCLASKAPLVLAPAMNQVMWENTATQANTQLLLQRGIFLFGPASGEQACGDIGIGRMQEPEQLVADLTALLQRDKPFSGIRMLITAGPTEEAIDPVRYLTNRSSGKMGYALARAAVQQGAEVVLVSGPTHLDCPAGVQCIRVTTAQQMYDAVLRQANTCDIFIATAAVADYRVETISQQKIKKDNRSLSLTLVRNADILAAVASLQKPPFTVGFAAETEHVREHALAKMMRKKLDMIVANDVSDNRIGFDANENAVLALWEGGEQFFPRCGKQELAEQLLVLLGGRCSLSRRPAACPRDPDEVTIN